MKLVFAFMQKCKRSEKALRALLLEKETESIDRDQIHRLTSVATVLTSKEETGSEEYYSGQCSMNFGSSQADATPLRCDEPGTTPKTSEEYLCDNKIEFAAIETVEEQKEPVSMSRSKAIGDFIAENTLNFVCNLCKASFSSRRSLNLHVNSRKCIQQTFECDICQKVFIKKRYLIRHLQRMHQMLNEQAHKESCTSEDNKRKYKCHLCPKG